MLFLTQELIGNLKLCVFLCLLNLWCKNSPYFSQIRCELFLVSWRGACRGAWIYHARVCVGGSTL